MRDRGREFLSLVLVVALWLVPAVAIVLTRNAGASLERRATSTASPVLARVGRRLDTGAFAGAVTVTADSAGSQLVGSEAGVVTWINAGLVSRDLRDGAPLLAENGRTIIAHVGKLPFYRDLAAGDVGPDVDELNVLLVRLGLLANRRPSTTFGSDTAAAVTKLRNRDGWPSGDTLTTGMTAYVPQTFGRLAAYLVTVGESVQPGQALAQSVPTVTRVDIAAVDPGVSVDVSGALKLSAGTRSIIVSSLEPPPDEYAGIQDFLAAAAASGVIAAPAAGTAAPTTYTGITVSRKVPIDVGAVPATAVYTAADGTECVFASEGSQAQPSAVVVPSSLPQSAEIAIAYVPSRLVSESVVVNPTSLTEAVRARCR